MTTDAVRSECPRCGYDQAGVLATWDGEGSCPMSGLCSECGLEFLWRDVLNPLYWREETVYEQAEAHLVRAFVRTWWLACRPWKLWKKVTMVQPLRPDRLKRVLLFGTLGAHIAGCVLLMVVFAASSGALVGWPSGKWRYHPVKAEVIHAALPVLGESIDSLDRWPGFANWGFAGQELVAMLSLLTPVVLMPLTWLLVPTTLERCGVLKRHLVRIWVYTVVPLGAVLTAPMAVLLMAWTALGLLFPTGRWGGWPEVRGTAFGAVVEEMIEERWRWMPRLVWAWLVLCQGWAFKRYLKLPRAWFVAVMLSVVTGLAMVVIGLVAWTSGVWRGWW